MSAIIEDIRRSIFGCELVSDTASPYKIDVQDRYIELLDPTRPGPRKVLEPRILCCV